MLRRVIVLISLLASLLVMPSAQAAPPPPASFAGNVDSSGVPERSYDVTVSSPGLLTSVLQWEGSANLNLTMRHVSSSGSLSAVLERSETRANPEQTSFEVAEPGDYRFFVEAASGAADFVLNTNLQSGPNRTFLGAVDKDGQSLRTYHFEVLGAGPIDASLDWPSGPNLNLLLKNPSGATVAEAKSKTDNPETISFDAPSGGTYEFTVKASSGFGPFSLTATQADSGEPAGSALVKIDPGTAIDGSTFNAGALQITNTSSPSRLIESVTIDLGTALLPDMVYDPVGTAGDALGKCLTADAGAAATGYVAPGDPCVAPFSSPHNGDSDDGYDAATVNFNNFGPNESFTYSVDIDPTSIKDATTTGSSGSVSGLELTGSTVTVEFSDGTLVSETYRIPNSNGGSQAVVASGGPDAVTLSATGVAVSPTTLSPRHSAAEVTDAQQLMQVAGPAGAAVKLMRVDASLLAQPGYDLEDFEGNNAEAVQEYSATIGAAGTVDVPVTLTETNNGGINHFIAVVDDGARTGPTSNIVVLELVEGNQPPVANNDQAATSEGTAVQIDLLANDTDDGGIDPASVEVESDPADGSVTVDGGTGVATYTPDTDFAGTDSFTYSVADGLGERSNIATVSITVTDGPPAQLVYRVNAGGPAIASPAWSGDTAASPSQFVNAAATTNQVYSTSSGGSTGPNMDMTDPSIPAGTPVDVFKTERWDPAPSPEMQWDFPVPAGSYEVRLYFAEIFAANDQPGERVLDVAMEGAVVLDNYDIVADVGQAAGVVKSFTVESDANLDIDFLHVVENPSIKGIEVLALDQPEGGLETDPAAIDFGDVVVGQTSDHETVTLQNTSSGPITINGASITGANAGDFAEDLAGPVVVNPGQTTTIDVTFSPSATSGRSGTLEIQHSGDDSPDLIPLSGMGVEPPAGGDVLYRINAGGPQITATDSGPAWVADTDPASPYRNTGSNNTGFPPPFSVHGSVPSSTPLSVFETERWDPIDDPEMQWDLPVATGTPVEVRLFFRDGYSETNLPGERVFDVSIDGGLVLDNYDLAASEGHNTAVMKSFTMTSDGNVDIDFGHNVENPLVNAIEVVVAGPSANQLGVTPTSISFGDVEIDETGDASVTLSNLGATGDPDIIINNLSVSGGDFSATLDGPATIVPGATSSVDVSFTPQNAGPQAEELTIAHSGSNSPVTIDLEGEGFEPGSAPISFTSSALPLSGANDLSNPTSLQFGPDDRLYASQQNGIIKVYDIEREGPNDYAVTDFEVIDLVQDIPNHNDNGVLNAGQTNRQVTGLLVAGTPANPILYVTSSDPRIGGGGGGTDTNLDTNSGIISRLTHDGTQWVKVDLVRGLPRSEENHSSNGMAIDETTNTLYMAQGGHTNKGAPSNNFTFLPEFAYSAAILSVDLDAIGSSTHDLPTLLDTPAPFGGQNGANMAVLEAGSPVQIHSPGWRNAYDVAITDAGRMYTIDNGPNGGWGGTPVNEGPGGTCTNGVNENNSTTHSDNLHFVSGPGYYGGHANPTRGNPAGSGFPTAVPTANAVECDYRIPGTEDGALELFGASTNGLAEYNASNFGSKMKGDLLAASFDGSIYRMQLVPGGDALEEPKQSLFSGFGSTPLDVTAQGDTDAFPGTVWAATYGSSDITVFEPGDFGGGGGPECTGADDGSLDEDEDGFDNADEIDNGTDPCSAASVPPDADGDGTSDLNDPDDDNDGAPDTSDPFAVDPDDGTTTDLPVDLQFNQGEVPGSLLDLGFTGLMTNGTSDYLDLFDPGNMTAGGAADTLGIDAVPDGDAYQTNNTQQYGFQYGVDTSAETDPFTAHTRVMLPFATQTPDDYQSAGMFIGNGDQNNYAKLVVSAKNGAGGIELLKEINGTAIAPAHPTVNSVVGSDFVDLWLTVDPVTDTLQGSYAVEGGPRIDMLGVPTDIPAAWTDGSAGRGLAVGVISTSFQAPAFPASWDFLTIGSDVEPEPSTARGEVTITPSGGINASTFGGGSFQVANTSGDESVDSVLIEVGGALLPDAVFDPNGTAGDTTAKGFTVDSAGNAGQSAHAFLQPHNGTNGQDGYNALQIDFTDFDPGEIFTFSVDMDPTSIKGVGAPGPNESGSVSGLELTGTNVTMDFDDGSTESGRSFRTAGSASGSKAVAEAGLPAQPGIDAQGVTLAPTTLSNRHFAATVDDASQTIVVSGDEGDEARLLRVEGGLFTAGVPGGGFDLEPFEFNSAVAVQEYAGVIPADGTLEIPVTLTEASANAGLNAFVATLEDAEGDTGSTSNIVVLDLEPDDPGPGEGTVIYRINAGGNALTVPDPDWEQDTTSSPSQYVNSGASNFTESTDDNIDMSHPSIPVGTPMELFQDGRWDKKSGGSMKYVFPVASGVDYTVRLYFAETKFSTAGKPRSFDVLLEDQLVLDNYNIFSEVGHDKGIVKSFDTTIADDFITIEFDHGSANNPVISAIEILQAD